MIQKDDDRNLSSVNCTGIVSFVLQLHVCVGCRVWQTKEKTRLHFRIAKINWIYFVLGFSLWEFFPLSKAFHALKLQLHI